MRGKRSSCGAQTRNKRNQSPARAIKHSPRALFTGRRESAPRPPPPGTHNTLPHLQTKGALPPPASPTPTHAPTTIYPRAPSPPSLYLKFKTMRKRSTKAIFWAKSFCKVLLKKWGRRKSSIYSCRITLNNVHSNLWVQKVSWHLADFKLPL